MRDLQRREKKSSAREGRKVSEFMALITSQLFQPAILEAFKHIKRDFSLKLNELGGTETFR
jgi:hypothetical protein